MASKLREQEILPTTIDQQYRTALHESAHAVVTRRLVLTVKRVALFTDGGGLCTYNAENVEPRYAPHFFAVSAVAAPLAESGLTGQKPEELESFREDFRRAAEEGPPDDEDSLRFLTAAVTQKVNALRGELLGEKPSVLELLVRRVVNGWLATHTLELELTLRPPTNAHDRAHLDRALSRAQKRFAEAARELARVRRLRAPMILAQINTAAAQTIVNSAPQPTGS